MNAAKKTKIPQPADYQPEKVFASGHRYAGRPRCLGWNGNTGRQCGKLPRKNRKNCRSHGGNTKHGPDHPRFKHGGYMKALKNNAWADHYMAYLDDPERASLAREIALMRSRVDETIAQIDTTATKDVLTRLEVQGRALLDSFDSGDGKAIATEANLLYIMIAQALEAKVMESELDKLLDRTTNMVQFEARHEAKKEEAYTINAVIALVLKMAAIFQDAVIAHVTDERQAIRVLEEAEAGIDKEMVISGQVTR